MLLEALSDSVQDLRCALELAPYPAGILPAMLCLAGFDGYFRGDIAYPTA
jgi:hypothetical protein